MKTVLVVAPHADDETLGCGGTLLRHTSEGDVVHWVIVTGLKSGGKFTKDQIKKRDREIKRVSAAYNFVSMQILGFPSARLDQTPLDMIIKRMSDLIQRVSPNVVYAPYRGDAHSDHSIVFDASAACAKWFRNRSISRFLVYETLSETDFSLNPTADRFRPNVFVDISKYLEKKLSILSIYKSEMGRFRFPRSEKAVRALASLRGAAAGFLSAEAFMLLKEVL